MACTLPLRAPCTNTTSRSVFFSTALSMLTSGVRPTPPLISTTGVVASMSTWKAPNGGVILTTSPVWT